MSRWSIRRRAVAARTMEGVSPSAMAAAWADLGQHTAAFKSLQGDSDNAVAARDQLAADVGSARAVRELSEAVGDALIGHYSPPLGACFTLRGPHHRYHHYLVTAGYDSETRSCSTPPTLIRLGQGGWKSPNLYRLGAAVPMGSTSPWIGKDSEVVMQPWDPGFEGQADTSTVSGDPPAATIVEQRVAFLLDGPELERQMAMLAARGPTTVLPCDATPAVAIGSRSAGQLGALVPNSVGRSPAPPELGAEPLG